LPKGRHNQIGQRTQYQSLPLFEALPDTSSILLKMGDDISTGIQKRGWYYHYAQYSEISKYSYYAIDPTFYDRAIENQKKHETIVL
jgi:aconitate hydratase